MAENPDNLRPTGLPSGKTAENPDGRGGVYKKRVACEKVTLL